MIGTLESLIISLLIGLCVGGAGGFYVGWNFTAKTTYLTQIHTVETTSDIQNINHNQTQVISGQYLMNITIDGKTNFTINTNINELTNIIRAFSTNTNFIQSVTNYITNK